MRNTDWSQKNLAFADDTLNEIVRRLIIRRKKLNYDKNKGNEI